MANFYNFCQELRLRRTAAVERGLAFELAVAQALNQASDRYSQVESWSSWVKKHPSHPAKDLGVDLVAWDNISNGWAAIQAKFYDQGSSIPKSGVDSFLAKSEHKDFKSRLLIITADLNHNAREMVLAARPRPQVMEPSDLDDLNFDWLSLSSTSGGGARVCPVKEEATAASSKTGS